jgi:hypothetical protein
MVELVRVCPSYTVRVADSVMHLCLFFPTAALVTDALGEFTHQPAVT